MLFAYMADYNLYNRYLIVWTCNIVDYNSNMFNKINNRVVYFNNLFACTRHLFFCRPVFSVCFSNLSANNSDCILCSCCLFVWTCRCVLCSCNLLVRSCRLFNLRHRRKLSKPICKTLNSTLQSKFCKKACIVLPRSGNFSNCLKVAFSFG